MDNHLYDYSAIVDRPAVQWPDGKRVAFYVGLNIEHYQVDKPSTSIFGGTAGLQPDPLNYGWRDYGVRVGIWRMIAALDKHGIRASAIINSDVCSRYPEVIKAGMERDWAWVAHGQDNSTFQSGMSREDETAYLENVVSTIEAHTGSTPKGWLGPALTETSNTPEVLAELGLSYVLDWCSDDQPFDLNVAGMMSVPYSIEVNDVTLFSGRNLSGEDFLQIVKDQYEQLSKDAVDSGRVMALCLHPFIINQPFRHKYLELALDFIAAQPDVWMTTSDDIAAHYRTANPRLLAAESAQAPGSAG
jgi:allantoinase